MDSELQELIDYLSPKKSINKIDWNDPEIDWDDPEIYKSPLSKEAAEKFQDDINWFRFSQNQPFLSWDVFQKFSDKINWLYVSMREDLSEDIILELLRDKEEVDWNRVSAFQTLSEDLIRKLQDEINWEVISEYQNLSEGFIREFSDKVNWSYISRNQNLSESFIREFSDKVHWYSIFTYQNLSDEFIFEFKDNIKWESLSHCYNDFSKKLLKRFYHYYSLEHPNSEILKFIKASGKVRLGKSQTKRINWKKFCQDNRDLSDKFIEAHLKKINWKYFSIYQNLTTEKIEKYKENLNWSVIVLNPTFTSEHIDKYANKITWGRNEDFKKRVKISTVENYILNNQNMTGTIRLLLTEFKLDDYFFVKNRNFVKSKNLWSVISESHKFSVESLKILAAYIDWNKISYWQSLSMDFIREFRAKVDWMTISASQKLNESFIEEFQDKVDWGAISIYQKLSEPFIRKFQNRVDWIKIWKYQKLSLEFLKEFIPFIIMGNSSHYYALSEGVFNLYSEEEILKIVKIYPVLLTNGVIINNQREWSEKFIFELAKQVDWQPYLYYNKNYTQKFKNKIKKIYERSFK